MDTLSTRITTLRNAQRAGRPSVLLTPRQGGGTRLGRSILRLLVREGYIDAFSVYSYSSCSQTAHSNPAPLPNQTTFLVYLKYGAHGQPAFNSIQRVSTSARRVYLPSSALWQPQSNLGLLVVSTPRGVLTDRDARQQGLGGEVLRAIWLKFMQSLLVPPSVSISLSSTHIRRAGPRGVRLRPVYPFNVRGRSTPEGRRLVVDLSDHHVLLNPTERTRRIATALSHLSQALYGVSVGYRRRLRLVGVGFRAVESRAQSVNSPINLKLGYSHDVSVPRSSRFAEGIAVTFSRIDGRAKGTLLCFEGPDLSRLNHTAVTIRNFRAPDAYKGKGIHFDREKLTLKKGKRET